MDMIFWIAEHGIGAGDMNTWTVYACTFCMYIEQSTNMNIDSFEFFKEIRLIPCLL